MKNEAWRPAKKEELPAWLYDEFQYVGVDYAAIETARKFDARHKHFRDFAKECEKFRARVGLRSTDVALDLGCGSGAPTLEIAKFCKTVYACDPSPAMLNVFEEKLAASNVSNVLLQNAGFLTFSPPPEPIDVAIASIALHHLPNFWKAVALKRVADVLKPGGALYVVDVVFEFPVEEWRDGVEILLRDMGAATSVDGVGAEAFKHVSAEFSDFDWAFEEAAARAGLTLEASFRETSFLRAFVFRKPRATAPRVLSVEESRRVDANASDRLKIPTLLLMENAGRSLADVFLQNAPRFVDGAREPRPVVFCGKGNNGGDGFAFARQLAARGLDPRAIVFAKHEEIRGDAAVNLEILRAICEDSRERVLFVDDETSNDEIARFASRGNWLVDALLGVGFRGELRPSIARAVRFLNSDERPIYAVDVPTGFDADRGVPGEPCVRAKMTTTLGSLKRGLIAPGAEEFVGELFVGELGVPLERLVDESENA